MRAIGDAARDRRRHQPDCRSGSEQDADQLRRDAAFLVKAGRKGDAAPKAP
jgi:hypothetical protein